MAAGSLAPNSANEIKQAKLALVGLAGQNWPISNTPFVSLHSELLNSSVLQLLAFLLSSWAIDATSER
jgi:hypothetical protein